MYAGPTYIVREVTGMLAFKNFATDIDEKATERMNFRTRPHIKKAIQQAASLSGVDDSVFTMSAAYSAALATIAAHERTVLQPVDHETFFAMLDAPAEPTPALREAFARHKARVASR
jgi:uncharacterized protein (DUF1778 family)